MQTHLDVGTLGPMTACGAEGLSLPPLWVTRNVNEVTCPLCKLVAPVAAEVESGRILVIVCPRTEAPGGWPCRNGCKSDVEVSPKALGVLARGGDVLCDVCARALARQHPDAFETVEE